ncbi:MAG TPA: gluconate 2-dehydrogenase subunit 3 family protein [Burkholderiaceae bacterium]
MEKISRRSFFKVAGATVATTATQVHALTSDKTTNKAISSPKETYTFFKSQESDFIVAAVERLIPSDENGPGAIDAGVPSYLDKQLGGAWGAGERLYRSGPWHEGASTQGYQLPFTPAELFRHALRGIQIDLNKRGSKPFNKLDTQAQDAYLKALESGDIDLDGVPSKVFFQSLLDLTIEGYFSDPVYGGNKDMVTWKMIGFPGAYATYYTTVDQYGMNFTRAPMSLAENGRGMIHIHPNIPASDKYQRMEK